MSKQRGKVKFYNAGKGFGLITPDNGGKDLSVHQVDLKIQGYRELAEGQHVEFEISQGPKGPHATNLHLIN